MKNNYLTHEVGCLIPSAHLSYFILMSSATLWEKTLSTLLLLNLTTQEHETSHLGHGGGGPGVQEAWFCDGTVVGTGEMEDVFGTLIDTDLIKTNQDEVTQAECRWKQFPVKTSQYFMLYLKCIFIEVVILYTESIHTSHLLELKLSNPTALKRWQWCIIPSNWTNQAGKSWNHHNEVSW